MDKIDLLRQLKERVEGVEHPLSNLANASAILFNNLENVNWVGFYMMEDGKLVLGPFQGRPAVVEIKVGDGVCGTAVKENRTIRVDNVHEFGNHIVCDIRSKSEIVIPLYKNEELIGVLDMDSPIFNRFTEDDREVLEAYVKELEKHI